MPRSRGGAPSRPSAPSRPTAPAPQRSVAPQQQTRPMSTAPAAQQQRPQAQAQSPGLFGQMASTAAGVAVGSSIGHAIGGFFGGGSSSAAAPEQQQQGSFDNYSQQGQAMDSGLYQANQQTSSTPTGPCAVDVKNFNQCMTQNNGDLNICGWYLEQLRACQSVARNY